MNKLLQRFIVLAVLLILFLGSATLLETSLYAQVPTKVTAISTESITSYAFTAHLDDSLSRIVRRALQLRAVTDQPTALYCENSIATTLGNGYITVGQNVVVPYEAIDSCVASAKNLTQEQRIVWQSYAETVNFDVNDVNPTNNSSNVVAPQPKSNLIAPPPTDPEKMKKTSTSTNSTQQSSSKVLTKRPTHYTSNLWFAIAAAASITIFLSKDAFLKQSKHR